MWGHDLGCIKTCNGLCHVMDVSVFFFFFCVSSKEKCDGSDVFVVIHFFDVMCVSEFISLPNENKICWYYIIFGSFQ